MEPWMHDLDCRGEERGGQIGSSSGRVDKEEWGGGEGAEAGVERWSKGRGRAAAEVGGETGRERGREGAEAGGEIGRQGGERGSSSGRDDRDWERRNLDGESKGEG